MAYVPGTPDDEEAKRRAAAGNPPGAFGDTTPTSTPTHTNFANVSDYLGKNPDASTKLGDLATGKLTAQRDEAQGAVDQAKTGFGQQVQAGGTTLDNSLLSSAFSSPETFTQDPNNTAKFLALRDASYKGPNSVQETDLFAPTQSKITALNQTGEGLGTEAGRTNLVEGLSSHPTHGKSALNQLLLQGSPEAAQKITDTAGTFHNVGDQWQQFLQDSPNQVAGVKATTDAARTATRSGLDTATQDFMSQLNAQTAKATDARDAFNLDYGNITKGISEGGTGLSQAQLDKLGASDAFPYITKLQQLNKDLKGYNSPVQLSNYETKPGSANSNVPTMASTANPQQYAREAALQQLAGHDLGLPDQQETPYQPNGSMPTLDAKGAFTKAGTDLKNYDTNWVTQSGGTMTTDPSGRVGFNGLSAPPYGDLQDLIGQMLGVSIRMKTSGYYTDPSVGATPQGGYTTAPAPEGWNSSQPPPYPAPTSNPPPNLASPQWNPYTGQWQGFQLQPNNPPPPADGGVRVTH